VLPCVYHFCSVICAALLAIKAFITNQDSNKEDALEAGLIPLLLIIIRHYSHVDRFGDDTPLCILTFFLFVSLSLSLSMYPFPCFPLFFFDYSLSFFLPFSTSPTYINVCVCVCVRNFFFFSFPITIT
jgi:hypothetical protein